MIGKVMMNYKSQAKLFKVLMHPARLEILEILRDGEECVCHMEAILGYRQAYISQHLMVLREAQLVEDRRDGWNIYYRVTQPEIYAVLDAARQMLDIPPTGTLPAISDSCPCPRCQKNRETSLFDLPIRD
jgi:ArsR family transcriptional regulator